MRAENVEKKIAQMILCVNTIMPRVCVQIYEIF